MDITINNLVGFAGKRFGKRVVRSYTEPRKRPNGKLREYVICDCDCGSVDEVALDNLLQGKSQQCRKCQHSEHSQRITTHGATKTKEWYAWRNMKNRCYRQSDKRYKDYGGRGVRVCSRWVDSFEEFLKDVGPAPSCNHSLERVNTDWDYEPGNVRWATDHEQRRNKRNNVWLQHTNGRIMCLSDWARELNVGQPELSKSRNRCTLARFGLTEI